MTITNSILDTNNLPSANSRVTYTYISGEDANGNYEWSQVSSFLSDASEKDVIRAVNSLRTQADDYDHVFIEGFKLQEDGSYEVVLGS